MQCVVFKSSLVLLTALSSFYRWAKWGSERERNLFQVPLGEGGSRDCSLDPLFSHFQLWALTDFSCCLACFPPTRSWWILLPLLFPFCSREIRGLLWPPCVYSNSHISSLSFSNPVFYVSYRTYYHWKYYIFICVLSPVSPTPHDNVGSMFIVHCYVPSA